LGRSRGGLTSKVHLFSDDRACPLHWLTSPGQRGDSPVFAPVLGGLSIRRGRTGCVATRCTPAGTTVPACGRAGSRPPIAQPDDQRLHRKRRGRAGGRPSAFDKARYRRRNAVERCVNKWKQFRAVATRLDKRDYIFNGALTVTAIVSWLRDTVQEPSEAP
jgi:transposase